MDLAYLISCSSLSNSSESKNSLREISKPSQNFFMVIIDTSCLESSNMLYAVDGVTPDMFFAKMKCIKLQRQNVGC